jgi:excisionase family DNA binding protein
MYTITEAAKKLGVTRQTIHEAIKNDRLKGEKTKTVRTVTATVYLIPESSLRDYQKLYSRKSRRVKK